MSKRKYKSTHKIDDFEYVIESEIDEATMDLYNRNKDSVRENLKLQLEAKPAFTIKEISKTRHYFNKLKKLISNVFNKPKPYGLYNGPHGVRSTFVFAKIK